MEGHNDFFSHSTISERISQIFRTSACNESFVIAIDGAWGTGKTHLMNSVLSTLNDSEFIKVNFNAWRYSSKEDIKKSLLVCIIDECKKFVNDNDILKSLGWDNNDKEIIADLLSDTERSLYSAFVKEIPGEISINTGNLVKTGLNLAMKFVPWGNIGSELIQKVFVKKDKDGNTESSTLEKEDIENLWGIFSRSSTKRNIEQIEGIEQFRKSFDNLLCAVLEGKCDSISKQKELKKPNRNLKLVVAIDDLDRCLPEYSLEILEAIKLFIDHSNTYFIIAFDSNIIQSGLNIRYHDYGLLSIRSKDYYEKMIDLSFAIPAVDEKNLLEYIKSLTSNSALYIDLFSALNVALKSNLRAWKRFICRTDFNLSIIHSMIPDLEEKTKKLFIKIQCLSYQWPEVYREIDGINTYIKLEETLRLIVNYKSKNLQDLLLELKKAGLENICNCISERSILDLILAEPKIDGILNVENNDTFNPLFTFDRIQL